MFPGLGGLKKAAWGALAATAFTAIPAYGQLFANAIPINGDNSDSDEFCAIATDEAGRWMAVWESRLGGVGDADISCAISDDNGGTWAPSILNGNAGTDLGDDSRPHLATDGNGTWITVWHSTTALPNIGSDEDIFYSVWTDASESWTAPAVLNSNAGTDGATEDLFPRIATDKEGRWVVVWSSGGSFGLNKVVNTAFSDDDGASWSAPTAIGENARIVAVSSPDIDFADDVWMVVWPSFTAGVGTGGDSDVVAATSADGAAWSGTALVNDYAALDDAPDIGVRVVAGGSGVWVVAWETAHDLGGIGTDKDILYARTIDDGATWSEAAVMNSNAAVDAGADIAPALASDREARIFCIWTSREDFAGKGEDADVMLARSSNSGLTWSTVTLVNTNATEDTAAEHDERPALATDRNGHWTAVWDTVGRAIDAGGPDADTFSAAALFPDPFDVNLDDLVNAADIQSVINAALGLDVGGLDTDLNNDGATNAVDVQAIIIEVLRR